jgi:hypothetical protein
MIEEPIVIEMNIAHYAAMLKLDLDHRKRSAVKRWLAEANKSLAQANEHGGHLDIDRRRISRKPAGKQRAAAIGRRLLGVVVYAKRCRIGGTLTLNDLAEASEIGDWKMPDFKTACSYAASQGWLIVEDDTLTLTTAGLAAA